MGVRRAPAYVTALGFPPAPGPSGQPMAAPFSPVVGQIQQAIASSSRLSSRDGIQVLLDGPVVVLRGSVADDHDRRLAEALARLTPGVRDVRNELQVPGQPAPSGPGQ
jgi:hypothetical protein